MGKAKAPDKELMDRALAVTFDSDGDDTTMREFLHALLSTLWVEEESFSGKRPLGNSGWQYAPIEALVEGGFAKDEQAAHQLMRHLIAHAIGIELT